MPTFTFNPDADVNGTYKVGEVVVVPARLVARFGPPGEVDGYKVSGEYRFTDDRGRVYTVYDWKETSLYGEGVDAGEESLVQTPAEFWGNENPATLQIGGRDDADVPAFKAWLTAEVG